MPRKKMKLTYHKPPEKTQLQTARRNLWAIFWETFYKKPFDHFVTKLYEAADIPMILTPWGDHKPFAIAKDGIITVISPSDPTATDHTGLRTILFEDLSKATKDTENDLLAYINLVKEWEWVERFVIGFALFPFTEKAAKKALGENISRRLNGALGLIERHSDPTEWTPATERVMAQYVEEHDWILDKIADRILQNMLLGGILK